MEIGKGFDGENIVTLIKTARLKWLGYMWRAGTNSGIKAVIGGLPREIKKIWKTKVCMAKWSKSRLGGAVSGQKLPLAPLGMDHIQITLEIIAIHIF